jgi:hypothetical protein
MGPVPKKRTNQSTFLRIEERSIHTQKIAIPKKTRSMDGIPIMASAPNRITRRFLAGEAFKNCETPGMSAGVKIGHRTPLKRCFAAE